jgi:hypothetical protein
MPYKRRQKADILRRGWVKKQPNQCFQIFNIKFCISRDWIIRETAEENEIAR